MSNKSNKNTQKVSYRKNDRSSAAVKKKQDRVSWITAGIIIAVALVGIILLAVVSGGGSANRVNGQQSPTRQQQTLPDCCE